MEQVAQEMREQIEKNFETISSKMDEYMALHANKFALMRDGEVIEFYATWEDAYKTGLKFFSDGLFSVQEVTKTPVDLGYFSHAVHIG